MRMDYFGGKARYGDDDGKFHRAKQAMEMLRYHCAGVKQTMRMRTW